MFKKTEKLNLDEKLEIKTIIEVLIILFFNEKKLCHYDYGAQVICANNFYESMKKQNPSEYKNAIKQDYAQHVAFFIIIHDIEKDTYQTIGMQIPQEAYDDKENKRWFYANLFGSLNETLNAWYQGTLSGEEEV